MQSSNSNLSTLLKMLIDPPNAIPLQRTALFTSDDPEELLMTDSLRMEIECSLDALSIREADVIRLYFGLKGNQPHTLEEIGQKFDLTRERIRQIKEKAIRRLKHASRGRVLRVYLG
jgi:RNA polymerase primary sigma factor